MRTRDLIVAADPEIRQGRQVQIEVSVAVGICRAHTFGGSDSAAYVFVTANDAFVVAPLMTAQSLSGRETPMADCALVSPSASASHAARAGGGGRGCRSGGLVVAPADVAAGGEFPVTSLMSSQGLVRAKSLITDGTLVQKLWNHVS